MAYRLGCPIADIFKNINLTTDFSGSFFNVETKKNLKFWVRHRLHFQHGPFWKTVLPYKVKKKILSDFNVFGVKWSVLTRLMHTKKLEVKILILAKVMNKCIFKKARFTGGCCESTVTHSLHKATVFRYRHLVVIWS